MALTDSTSGKVIREYSIEELKDAANLMRGYDLVMCANQWGAPEIFEEPQPVFHFLGKPSLTMPFNVTGQPGLVIPAGFSTAGLPLSLQLAGRPFTEPMLYPRRPILRGRDRLDETTPGWVG